MPSLIGSLDAKIAAQQSEKVNEADAQRAAREAKDEETFAKLDRLLLNEDWRWFHETFLKGFVEGKDSEMAKALDIGKPPEIRNNHAQRFDIAQKIISLAQVERDKLLTRIQQRSKKASNAQK